MTKINLFDAMLSEGKIRQFAEMMDVDPAETDDAVAKLGSLRETFNKIEGLLQARDPVVCNHIREIIQYGCDIISHVDEEFDPTLLRGIVSLAAGVASSRSEGWSEYTKEHSPTVNANLVEALALEANGGSDVN